MRMFSSKGVTSFLKIIHWYSDVTRTSRVSIFSSQLHHHIQERIMQETFLKYAYSIMSLSDILRHHSECHAEIKVQLYSHGTYQKCLRQCVYPSVYGASFASLRKFQCISRPHNNSSTRTTRIPISTRTNQSTDLFPKTKTIIHHRLT